MSTRSDALALAFKQALHDRNAAEIRRLLEGYGVNVPILGATLPIHLAAEYCQDIQILNGLLLLGADINARDGLGQTPLHYAAGHDNIMALQWLLEHGVDPNAHCKNFSTALHLAAYGNAEATALLLRYGAHANGVSVEAFDAPLHLAAHTCVDCIHLLMKYGADINRKDKFGDAPIAYAFGWAREANMKLMVEEAKALLQYESMIIIENPKVQEIINTFKAQHNFA